MENKDFNFIEHLDELRSRIIKVLVAFIVTLIVGFVFVQDIYKWLIKDLEGKLAILGPTDVIYIYMMLSAVFAIAITIPILAYQVWRFVSPALTKKEQKITLSFIPGFFFLFLIGLSFGYFVLFPIVLSFLTTLTAGNFEMMFTADKYFRFMINLTVPFAFLFEMPLVIIFLTRLGIVNPIRLAKARKLSYFSIIVIAILITPPDFISDILVIIPLLLLYEISVMLSKMIYKKQLIAKESAESAA